MNVIIIAILVILVLVIVAAFFLGGFSNLIGKINQIFTGRLSGTDLPIAVSSCESKCIEAQGLPSNELKRLSGFCTTAFNLDVDGDGEAEYVDPETKDQVVKFYCNGRSEGYGGISPLDIGCAGVANLCTS